MKICLIDELFILQLANKSLNEESKELLSPEKWQHFHKIICDRIRYFCNSMPRNCKYKDHGGTCKLFCDCGCVDGMKLCENEGD